MEAAQATSLNSFTERWLGNVPALPRALVYLSTDQREYGLIAISVVFELLEAAFALSEEHLAKAKLAWWQEEALMMMKSAARHPLSQALDIAAADGSALAHASGALIAYLDRPTAPDLVAQLAELQTLAAALADFLLSGPWQAARQIAPALPTHSALAANLSKLVLCYQLHCLSKPGRFGPCALPAKCLASEQLRRDELHQSKADAAIRNQALDLLRQSSPLGSLGFTEALLAGMAQALRNPNIGVWRQLRHSLVIWNLVRQRRAIKLF